MTSGHYLLNESNAKTNVRADTSFRACIISLLAFLLLCVIVIIILILTSRTGKRPLADGEHTSAALSSGEEGTPSIRATEGDKIAAEEESKRSKTSTESTSTVSTATTATTPSEEDRAFREKYLTETFVVDSGTAKSGRYIGDKVENNTSPPPTPPPSGDRLPPPLPPVVPTIPSTPPPPLKPEPCEEEGCKELAANILHTMGHRAQPCSNFYEYACGGLQRNRYLLEPDYPHEAFHRIKGMIDSLNGTDPTSFKKFKILEESCNNYDPHTDIQKWKNAVLEEITYLGGIFRDSDSFEENFTQLFLGFLEYDRPIIAEMTLDVNDLKPSTFLINIFSANLFKDQIRQDDGDETECHAKLDKRIVDLHSRYENIKDCLRVKKKSDLLKAANESLRILNIFTSDEETKLKEVLNDYEKFIDKNTKAFGNIAERRLELQARELNNKTIGNMNEIFKELKVNWTYIIEKLMNKPMKEDEKLQIYSESYFEDIIEEMNKGMSKRQLHNSLLVAFVVERYRDLVEAQQFRRRTEPLLHCTRLAALLLPDVASALYLRTFHEEDLKILEMQIENTNFDLLGAYDDAILDSVWLSDRRTLQDGLTYKLTRIGNFSISKDPNLRNTEQLDESLKMYTIDEMDFVKNALVLMKRNRRRLYERYDKDPINYIWSHFALPYNSKGVSVYSLKIATIPFGVIEKPFFLPSYLPHMKMAGLGFVLAREMAHHLDKIGIKFDCFNDTSDFDYYKSKLPTFFSSASASLKMTDIRELKGLKYNEWLADRIGIKIAYQAFNKRDKKVKIGKLPKTLPFLPLTNDQQFFVFLAQKYCTKGDISYTDLFESEYFPSKTRVEQMFNIKEFYEVFNCSTKTSESDSFPYSETEEEDSPALEGSLTTLS